MANFRKVLWLLLSIGLLFALAVMPEPSFLWKEQDVFEYVPLYRFLRKEAQQNTLREDVQTSEQIIEKNGEYLAKKAEEENRALQMGLAREETPPPVPEAVPSSMPEAVPSSMPEVGDSVSPVPEAVPSPAPEVGDSVSPTPGVEVSVPPAPEAEIPPSPVPEAEVSPVPEVVPSSVPEGEVSPVPGIAPSPAPEAEESPFPAPEVEVSPSPAPETEILPSPAPETEGSLSPAPETEGSLSPVPEAELSPAPEVLPVLTPCPEIDLSAEALENADYVLQNFFIMDENAALQEGQIDAQWFLGEDLSLKEGEAGPQILIYHSHSQETFADSREGVEADTIVGVGDYLEKLLTDTYGYEVLHIRETFDIIDGELDRSRAYDFAGEYIGRVLEENPQIQVVIDLHRDGVDEDRHLITSVNGKDTAQIMLYNGLSCTAANGPVEYLPNPYIQQNLAFSFQLEYQGKMYYPQLYRGIYLAGLRYNLHLRPRAILLEAGAQTNTVQEVKNAMEPFAEMLNRVLKGIR